MIRLLVTRPDLVLDHLSGYTALAQEEAQRFGQELIQRIVAWVLAGIFGLLAAILTGVALMMGVMMQQFHWALAVVPGVCLAATALALVKACKPGSRQGWQRIRDQFDADAAALEALEDAKH